MGSNQEINDLKSCYSSLKSEMKKSLEAIRIEERKIEKLKNDFNKKISSSVDTLVQNHHLFKKNLFICLMKNPVVKNGHRIRTVSVDSVEFSTSCFDSTREIRMKMSSESGRRSDAYLRLYKNFFTSNISNSELQNLVVSYLSSFERLEQMITEPTKNSFTVEEYVKLCKTYNVAHLYDDWSVFSVVSNINISKDQFEKQIKVIRDEETVKKTLRVLKR